VINEFHKFVFIHIPRTGGTSIEQSFDSERIPNQHMQVKHIPDKFPDYFKFAFVRNPWERMVSYYFMDRYSNGISFLEFVKLIPIRSKLEYRMLPYIINSAGKIAVDFLGRYETIQEDFDEVCDKMGVCRSDLSNYNKTNHGAYTEYYDEESYELVSNMFADDISEFDYKFSSNT